MAILIDDETRTYWHHLTGRALTGQLEGEQLPAACAPLLSKREALQRHPGITVAMSRALITRVAGGPMSRRAVRGTMIMPPHFRSTLTSPDGRLPLMQNGLGVFDAARAVFFPMARGPAQTAQHPFGDRQLVLDRDADGTPRAVFEGGGQPDQLFGRWYGFSYTFPACELGPQV